ncbi:MAG: hypothetical protein Q8R36_05050, partial [bacterium]|nr:hypothetical protein [bacterium]
MGSEFFTDGKKYISSKRAAEISGYANDYIGQLCRKGKLECHLIGKTWFVSENSLLKHKNETRPGRKVVKENQNFVTFEKIKPRVSENANKIESATKPLISKIEISDTWDTSLFTLTEKSSYTQIKIEKYNILDPQVETHFYPEAVSHTKLNEFEVVAPETETLISNSSPIEINFEDSNAEEKYNFSSAFFPYVFQAGVSLFFIVAIAGGLFYFKDNARTVVSNIFDSQNIIFQNSSDIPQETKNTVVPQKQKFLSRLEYLAEKINAPFNKKIVYVNAPKEVDISTNKPLQHIGNGLKNALFAVKNPIKKALSTIKNIPENIGLFITSITLEKDSKQDITFKNTPSVVMALVEKGQEKIQEAYHRIVSLGAVNYQGLSAQLFPSQQKVFLQDGLEVTTEIELPVVFEAVVPEPQKERGVSILARLKQGLGNIAQNIYFGITTVAEKTRSRVVVFNNLEPAKTEKVKLNTSVEERAQQSFLLDVGDTIQKTTSILTHNIGNGLNFVTNLTVEQSRSFYTRAANYITVSVPNYVVSQTGREREEALFQKELDFTAETELPIKFDVALPISQEQEIATETAPLPELFTETELPIVFEAVVPESQEQEVPGASILARVKQRLGDIAQNVYSGVTIVTKNIQTKTSFLYNRPQRYVAQQTDKIKEEEKHVKEKSINIPKQTSRALSFLSPKIKKVAQYFNTKASVLSKFQTR